jgi:hypothetical protein
VTVDQLHYNEAVATQAALDGALAGNDDPFITHWWRLAGRVAGAPTQFFPAR